MPTNPVRALSFFVFWICLTVWCVAQPATSAPTPQSAAASSPKDEAELRAVVEQFFAAYAKEDLDGVMRLWSEKSPDYAERKKTLADLFAKEDYSFRDLVLTRVKVESAKASLRLTLERGAVNLGTKQARTERLALALKLVNEGGSWRLWSYQPVTQEVAAALLAAQSAGEQQALLEQEQAADLIVVAALLRQQAGREYGQQNYAAALKIFSPSLAASEKAGDQQGASASLNNIGAIYYAQSNYTQALDFYQRSLQAKRTLNDKAGIARSLNNLGNVYFDLSDYAQALEHYQSSLRLKEELNDQAGLALSLSNLGSVKQTQGHYTQALVYLKQGMQIAEKLSDKAVSAACLNNIGNVYDSQGNYAQAVEHYHLSLRLSEELNDKSLMARALGNLGGVLRKQGRFAEALESQQRSLRLNQELESPAGIAATLNNIANIYGDQGQNDQALAYYQRSLRLNEEIGSLTGAADCWNNIAVTCLALGDYEQARQSAEKSAAIAQQLGRPDVLWEAQYTEGIAYRRLGRTRQARQAFTGAIATIERMRSQIAGDPKQRQIFFEDRLSPYSALIELLVEQQEPAAGLALAEKAKARVILDTLQSGRFWPDKAMTPAEREQEKKLLARMVTLNAQLAGEKQNQPEDGKLVAELNASLDRARGDYESFLTTLYATHPQLRAQRVELTALSLEEVNALLPDDKTALLEFAVAEDKMLLFVLTKAAAQTTPDLKIFTIPLKAKDLAGRAQQFRAALASRDLSFKQEAAVLYDLLLKPAQAQLKGKSSLVIVPDGALWELPFQALLTNAQRFLIEDVSISYAPSLTYLREMSRKRPPGPAVTEKSLMAIGNPALTQQMIARAQSQTRGERLEPLPLAEKEALELAKLYGHGESKVYVGAAALEERFKAEAGNYRILHLATHGVLDARSPMYSHVLLSQANNDGKEDGLLEAWEIMNLDLKADLAVLSACETARGRIGAGEGVIGLSWALFVAGVPTTVVSQWKVLDMSTRELMVEFHRQLRTKPEQGKAEALRQASLKLLKQEKYRHPFYWAGFVLVGDGK